MSIKQYRNEAGEIRFRVVVSRRSKLMPAIRLRGSKRGLSSKAEAQRMETKLGRQLNDQLAQKERSGVSWGTLVGLWELAAKDDRLEKPLSPSTLRDYRDALRVHTKEWNADPAAFITRGDVRALMRGLLTLGKSRSVCHKLRSAINSVFVFGVEEKHLAPGTISPARGVEPDNRRQEEKPPEILTIEEVRRLLEVAKQIEHPMYEVFVVALHTGMRSGELWALEWRHIDFVNRLIMVQQKFDHAKRIIGPTKGRDWRKVWINDELLDFLVGLRRKTGKEKYVLPRFAPWKRGEQARYTRELCKIAGVPSVRFHALRACWTTELLRQGVPQAKIMMMGGWKSLSRMEIYARVSGINIQGATDSLSLIAQESESNVKRLRGNRAT